ncbi:ras-like protein rasD [Lineus longissimus]|uniref:ras-like protein rasD n=1 Tax=Lineus longissimus TaxID=88925 RepID=UPI002B4F8282
MSGSQGSLGRGHSKGLRVYRIVILGDGGVGKSALTIQFVTHRFLDYHDPTIEDAYQKQAKIDDETALLDILDTAGQPEFTAMRDQYMRHGEGFILCYSISDRRSFEMVMENKTLIDRVRNRDDMPLVLVATKCDLKEKRVVSTIEGQALARRLKCPFVETSAALRYYVDEAFYEVIRSIRRKEQEESYLNKAQTKEPFKQKIRGFFQSIKGSKHSRGHKT